MSDSEQRPRRRRRLLLPSVGATALPLTLGLGFYWLGVALGWWLDVKGLWPLLWGWPVLALGFGLFRQSPLGSMAISVLLGITLLIGSVILNFEPARVHGASMEPTLQEGDVLLVDMTDERLERFGVYVLELENEKGHPLVKRLVGLPDEHITVRYYRVFADDEEVYPRDGSDSDVWYKERPARARLYNDGLHLADTEYFFLGDNPPGSRDSRHFGAIEREHVQGRVVWSLRGTHGFGPFIGE